MSFGLANGAGLAYLLAVPLLVLIYYFSRKGRRVEVSSIIPWRALKESAVRRARFRADLLFFVQLVLLVLLALAASRPYWKGAGEAGEVRHVVMVMDRSASMQADEGGRSRWAAARERALHFVRRLGDDDRVTLIASGSGHKILAAGESDRGRVAGILRGLDATDAPDSLGPALELAVSLLGEPVGGLRVEEEERGRSVGATELRVFSDRSLASLGLDGLPSWCEAHLERFGAPRGNAAITSLEVYRNLFLPSGEDSAYVTVENFSERPFSGSLRVLAAGREVASEEIAVAPGAAETTLVAEGRTLPEGDFEVVLEPPDTLAVDNRARARTRRGGTSPVLLVAQTGGCVPQFRAVADAAPALELEVARPGEAGPAEVGRYRAVIFYRCEPESEPTVNTLIICPPVKSRFAAVRQPWVPDARFVDWDEDHPVAKNLRGLHRVEMAGCRLFEVPPWARPVVLSTTTDGDVPLVFCGERGGRKVAVTTFDLAGIDLTEADSVPALILVLNLLGWLCADEGNQVRTGDTYSALVHDCSGDDRGARRRTVLDPRGRGHRIAVDPSGWLVFHETEYAGRYVVRGGPGEETFLANFFDRGESDLRRGGSGETMFAMKGNIPLKASAQGIADEPPADLSGLFLLLSLTLLLIEWFYFAIRGRASKASAGAG